MSDPARIVSVEVPRTWYDNNGVSNDPDEPTLLAATNLWQSRWVVVDRWPVGREVTLRSFHDEGVDHECSTRPCATRSGPRALTVDGHDALEQILTHPADADEGATTLVVLTVWTDAYAIEVYAGATAGGDTAPRAAPLQDLASSLRLA